MNAMHDLQHCVQVRLLKCHNMHAAGQAAARAHHVGQGARVHSKAPPRHMPCKAGTTTVAPLRDAASLPGLPIFNGQGLAVAFAGAWGMPERSSNDGEDGWEAIRGAASSPAAVMPKAPPEWQPPTDPSGPSAPPEFMPPREPGAVPGTVPEFEPPEQAPPGTPRPTDPPTPGRPARPEEIPDPERDPLRTPERRRETSDPDEQPSEEPEPQQQDLMSAVAGYVEHCAERFTVEDEVRGGGVKIGLGPNSCPAVMLYHPAGYTAVVNMHGANVVSWKRPDGTDVLHLRADSPMDGVSPILGGLPLVFPQYGRASGVAAFAGVGSGAVPSHGFLSRLHWTLVETGVSPRHAPDPAPTAVFAAEWDDDTYAMWPHRFGAIYTVSMSYTDEAPPLYADLGPLRPRPRRHKVDEPVKEEPPQPTGVFRPRGRPPTARKWKALDDAGNAYVDPDGDAEVEEEPEKQLPLAPMQLRCNLQVYNIDEAPFTFEAALQSHVRCADIKSAEAIGLGGKTLLDCDADPDRPRVHLEQQDPTTFGEGRMDRVYIDVGKEGENEPLRIYPGAGANYTLELIHRVGLRDLGVWNPHTQMPDRNLYRRFVALSSGAIARPVTLQPNEHWCGEMVLRLHELDATRGEGTDESDG